MTEQESTAPAARTVLARIRDPFKLQALSPSSLALAPRLLSHLVHLLLELRIVLLVVVELLLIHSCRLLLVTALLLGDRRETCI